MLSNRGFRLASLIAAVTLVAVACSKGGATEDASAGSDVDTYSGYVIDPPHDVSAVDLPVADVAGTGSPETFNMAAKPGGLNLIYFGYTFCPDVCPTTMSDIRKVREALPADDAADVGMAMVTIDPNRDTAQVLTDYVHNFGEDGMALRTDDEAQLREAADAFGADFEVTTNDEGEVEVSHTGQLYAVDDSGHVVMVWPFGTTAESMTRDVKSLLATERSQ